MGFGLPAAIGAALATGRTTLCITGDGSISLSLPELSTLAELGLPVKILVLDNGQLGMVRQQQQLFFEKRYIAAHYGQRVDFANAAQALGLPGYRLPYGHGRHSALLDMLNRPGPLLIHAEVADNEQVLPIVPPGAGNLNMIQTIPETYASPWDTP